MKRSRFIEEQIIAILKEQEAGMATAEVCRRHGISSATFNVSARPERHRSASRAAFFTGCSATQPWTAQVWSFRPCSGSVGWFHRLSLQA